MSQAHTIADIAQRLAPVHVGLRSDLDVTRHVFRGQPYYVLHDPLTFQTHQFSQRDYQVLTAIDDARSLGDTLQSLVAEGLVDPHQEDEFYGFVLRLHQMGYLSLPIADAGQLYARFVARQRSARLQRVTGCLFLRVPMFNPDTFLERTVWLFRPLFTRLAFVLWLALMLFGATIVWQRWDSFRSPVHSILANNILAFLWVALISLKVVHEFGHAYACKIFGGRVPEMGAYFIALTPCAYVDATAAWGFPSKMQRIIVSLAGMYFESLVAVLALIVWNWTENPTISSCAHYLVLLASAVTIGFNVNPLMRYDGYYVFSDLLEIPNLRQRSVQQVQALLKRLLLGIRTPTREASRRVRGLLAVYGVASVLYKLFMIAAICAMIALKFYLVGVTLAVIFALTMITGVMRRLLVYLWRGEETRPVRLRAVAVSVGVLVVLPLSLLLVPIPGRVVLPGVLQTRDDQVVYAAAGGFVDEVRFPAGTRVDAGAVLCRLTNAQLDADVQREAARTHLLELRQRQTLAARPHATAAAQVRLHRARLVLAKARREQQRLEIVAPIAGVVTQLPDPQARGQYVRPGERIAAVSSGPWIVRCLATADQITQLQASVGMPARVRLAGERVHQLAGTVTEVAVKGKHQVFSPALTQLAGGQIVVDPASLESANCHFELVVQLAEPGDAPLAHDLRVTACFAGQQQTLAAHVSRRLRQFFNKLRLQ